MAVGRMTAEIHFATDTYVTAAVVTTFAGMIAIAGWLWHRAELKLIEIAKNTRANGLDTDSTGDSSKRTENKVDQLINTVNEIKKTLKLHAAVLDALVDGDDDDEYP